MNIKRSMNKALFLAAVKGIEARHVSRALNMMTPGHDWRDCSKTLMAENYAIDNDDIVYTRRGCLHNLDLSKLVRLAKERETKLAMYRY